MEKTLVKTVKVIKCSILILCLFILTGCLEDKKELEKTILAHDPFFNKWISKRVSVEEDIAAQNVLYGKKIDELDAQIENAKAKKVAVRTKHAEEIKNIKKQLDPEKQNLRESLVKLRSILKMKRAEVLDAVNGIKEVKSLMDKKDRLEFTREEVQVWNRKLTILLQRKERLEEEIAKDKKEIEINNMKLKVLEI